MACVKQHQPVTWTNIDLSSKLLCGIHLWAISQEMPTILIRSIRLEIIILRLLPHFPVANELNNHMVNIKLPVVLYDQMTVGKYGL